MPLGILCSSEHIARHARGQRQLNSSIFERDSHKRTTRLLTSSHCRGRGSYRTWVVACYNECLVMYTSETQNNQELLYTPRESVKVPSWKGERGPKAGGRSLPRLEQGRPWWRVTVYSWSRELEKCAKKRAGSEVRVGAQRRSEERGLRYPADDVRAHELQGHDLRIGISLE